MEYHELIGAMKICKLVLTDSGGIQEEAPSLGKPVLVLRQTTERYEGIEAGTAKLVGSNPKDIEEETAKLYLMKMNIKKWQYNQIPMVMVKPVKEFLKLL